MDSGCHKQGLCVPMNNSDPTDTWAVVSAIMAPNGHSCPLLEGYQDSAIWATVPCRVSRKTVQPSLEEWEQNPRRTGLGEEADLGEESTPSFEVPALPPHKVFLLPSSLGRLLLSQADCSHTALSSLPQASAGPAPTVCRKFQACPHLLHTHAFREVCTRCRDTLTHHIHTQHIHACKMRCKKKDWNG